MHPDDPTEPRPAGWQDELDEIRRRRDLASAMGGEARVARHHASGRLTARERIALLLDNASFREIGSLAGASATGDDGTSRFTPSNSVIGTGRIADRRICVSADDFTIRGGSSEAAIAEKWLFAERWALEHRTPLVRLADAAGGSIKLLEKSGFARIPGYSSWPSAALLGTVPVVGVAMGPCAGLAAAKVVLSHFSVMVAGTSQVFAGGPKVVAPGVGQEVGKEELGGTRVHARRSGAVDNEAPSEELALEQARRFLSYLPSSVYELPPCIPAMDPADRPVAALRDAIPRDRRKPYEIRPIIDAVVDEGSFFEIGRYWARSVVTGLARLRGRPVGIIANDTMQLGGTVTAESSDKVTRFVDLCDTFHLPVVDLVDQPGVGVGVQAEEKATLRKALRLQLAIEQSTVPWCPIFLRRAFGIGGGMYAPLWRTTVRYAWPSAFWGSIPIEGGVDAAYRAEIEAADDPARRREELVAHFRRFESPLLTAERFGVEEMLDPAATRAVLCEWVEDAYRLLPEQLGPTGHGYRV